MRTAIVSDLHLGSAPGEDLLRDPEIRRLLLTEIERADRLVLLGDALELRELPLAPVLETTTASPSPCSSSWRSPASRWDWSTAAS